MKLSFEHLMGNVLRLTRGGDLRAATAAIQAALARHAPVPGAAVDAVDIEARFIDAEPLVDAEPATEADAAFVSGRHADAGLARDYKLYIPPQAGGGAALPLIVMLHGCTQDPSDFAAGTRMNMAALEQGFFVLYPAQAQEANPQRCWNWFKHNHQQRGRGEPALLAGMTRAVMAQHAIDPRRVYVTGLSAGGAMAAILGDAYPDLYAAVGVHSGLPTGAATDVNGAFAAMQGGAALAGNEPGATPGGPPTIVFHGDQDATVHPLNADQVIAACRAGAAHASEQARESPAQGHDYTRRVYRDATGRPQAEHWLVHGAGHAWSGGSKQGSYTDPKGPDASAEMLRFFFANPKPLSS